MAELLAELDADPAYRRLDSVLWLPPAKLLGGQPDPGHYFRYWPSGREPHGLLVALHGHGGNTHLWLHVWRRFADTHRFTVVCPTFGYGNWEHPAGVEAVRRCLDDALARFAVDPARVILAGISQGGAGVGRAAAAMPERFAGLVFLSPTMEPKVLGSAEFVAGWRGRPVLVVQGGRDHNVKPATVTAAVELMRRNGVDVTYHLDPAADHFLFFAQLDEMHRLLGEWLTRP
jgi:pimeloyl-ACP methyl ester carboxylesterase